MLKMNDLPPKRIRDAKRQMARGTWDPPPGRREEKTTPNRKILTIADLPRRNECIKIDIAQQLANMPPEMVKRVQGGLSPFSHEKLPVYSPINAWDDYTVQGQREFKSVMRDGAWSGRRCFIVGGGPSLKGFDWSQLDGELSIGVNRAFEVYDPSIMFSVDYKLWAYIENGNLGEDAKQRYYNYKGNRVWSSLGNFIFPREIYTINRPNPAPRSACIGSVRMLDVAHNSGYGALNLAAALGANPIYMLGFDMHGDHRGNQKWWHNGYPDLQNEGVYETFKTDFNKFAPVLQNAGFEVINLNPKSSLQCFKFGEVEDVFQSTAKKMPLFVSFYTEGSGYQREAWRLMESLHRLGLEYDIQGIPDKGNWHENVRMKPVYLLQMLRQHPGRDIVWVDADAVIHMFPDVFRDFKGSVGAHTINWGDHPNVKKGHTELLSGTVYLKNSDAVHDLVKKWIKVSDENPKLVDQVTLRMVLKGSPPNFHVNIPATYCQIFDSMALAGDPVIEHYQASRRLKVK